MTSTMNRTAMTIRMTGKATDSGDVVQAVRCDVSERNMRPT
jgi:hypothetical protein